MTEKRSSSLLDSLRKTVGEFLYGMTVHELDLEIRKDKGHLNNLFMLIVFGDLVGLPILPPFYSMRILPHIIPHLDRWKKGICREKDITEIFTGDL
ncbi:MAG: hypothetical protein A4E60_02085 [Syntrophorhabdus sp. PtaB.Bin047]|nr:MAG: hypothetical protein A4E60_02085 [Syntrophorhabdus sp. PtaB.Bin047]